jgi:hypothetical protein
MIPENMVVINRLEAGRTPILPRCTARPSHTKNGARAIAPNVSRAIRNQKTFTAKAQRREDRKDKRENQ